MSHSISAFRCSLLIRKFECKVLTSALFFLQSSFVNLGLWQPNTESSGDSWGIINFAVFAKFFCSIHFPVPKGLTVAFGDVHCCILLEEILSICLASSSIICRCFACGFHGFVGKSSL